MDRNLGERDAERRYQKHALPSNIPPTRTNTALLPFTVSVGNNVGQRLPSAHGATHFRVTCYLPQGAGRREEAGTKPKYEAKR